MKKKIVVMISIIFIVIIAFVIGTGFQKRTDVVLGNYSVSEDETSINLEVHVSSSMGYIRGFKNKGGGVKSHYLTFYSTFGGLNSSFGAKKSFVLELDSNDSEIYFNRPNGGYELVLVKNEATGQWIRPQDETITYNGREYKKSELCNATLHWLQLSDEEKMFSSYLPPEFLTYEESWGITLTVENVTPSGVTIKCTQSGGEPTGELNTGSWYSLETWTQENGWKEMPYVIDGEFAWTSEGWIIPMNDSCEWEVNWEWLYGQIPAGKYRIGKEIVDFRGPGDYDKAIYYAEFVVE